MQVRIQDFAGGAGGASSEAKSCRSSEVESHEWSGLFVVRVKGLLKGIEAFGFLILK